MAKLRMAGLEVYGHFMLTVDYDVCLACGFFDRSKTKVRGVSANFGKSYKLNWGYSSYSYTTDNSGGWTGAFSTQNIGRDRFTYCVCVSKEIGSKYLVTTKESCLDDVYEYLMNNYKLPLKREWTKTLLEALISEGNVRNLSVSIEQARYNDVISLPLNGREVDLNSLMVYSFAELKEEHLETVLSSLLSTKQLVIVDEFIPPLAVSGLDDYFNRYGCKVVDNLNQELNPLVELRPNVRNLALKSKSLFPQQAASVEGVLAMERYSIPYATLIHGMGCGKTLEAASVVEASMVEKWLAKNPGKTLRDAYEKEGLVNYRVIVMAPSHLVEKWASEVRDEIPYAKTFVVHDFSQFVALREAGRKPVGKEYYIISKDFCKLDTQISPIPVSVKSKYAALGICSDCKEEQQQIVYKRGVGSDAHCPTCHGNHFEPYHLSWLGTFRGLTCPKCGELLIKYKKYDPDGDGFDDKMENNVLKPSDFAHAKAENSCCYHCGAPLWGANAKPLVHGGVVPKESKWYKVTHFKNHTHKSTSTAFVLKGHEEEYYRTCLTTAGLKVSNSVYGPRKVAPAHYIKKYLKGFFDFCILDECHKYLGESAQAVAAHALVKASRFTLPLTGTISNGTASSFYHLFWMLEPKRMLEMGYHYSAGELMRFAKAYGCVETVYETSGKTSQRDKNLMSRGKQLGAPQVKPGISPVLLGSLLMDRCLFMDISDLSKYLPKLKEEVCLVSLPEEVQCQYDTVTDTLREASMGRTGMAALSANLQFGLSFPDKPYGRLPIMDPFCEDSLLCNVRNFDEYASSDVLLPKEQKLIELVKEEITQGRGVFVYATFTNKAETNIAYRLKEIIERYCNLKGHVDIIQSASPKATEREQWFHKRASEGIKVFITNPKCVETGLDFCFKHNGVTYNYPTIIFYQTSYELATIWQASRRAFRLNQKEDCRVIYLAYQNTLQAAALQIMAKKQVATAAIQGHFSAEGLSSMAQGVDARTLLAEALAKNDMSSRDELENMFDVLGNMNENITEEDAAYANYKPSPTFWELIGKTPAEADSFEDSVFANAGDEELWASLTSALLGGSETADTASFDVDNLSAAEKESATSIVDDFLSFFSGFGFGESVTSQEPVKKASKRSKSKGSGIKQMTVFDLLTDV